jgi:hypothetical protein
MKRVTAYTMSLKTTYHEMAEHYNLTIIPARVRKPKDKLSVEGAVGKISTWINTNDIESHMRELYDIEISDSTISRITDKSLPIVKEWQERPLEEI